MVAKIEAREVGRLNLFEALDLTALIAERYRPGLTATAFGGCGTASTHTWTRCCRALIGHKRRKKPLSRLFLIGGDGIEPPTSWV